MQLYQINQRIESLLEYCSDPDTGEFIGTDELLVELNELEIEKSEKAVSIGCYIKGLNAESEAIAEEEQKLRQRRKSLDRRSEWLKGYLEYNHPGESIKDARCCIGWRKSQAVEIIDADIIPETYFKIVKEISKQAIKDDIKKGLDVPGAIVVERQNIQIR